MAELLIAMDVGGTKTETLLFDTDGNILRRTLTPGANPLVTGFDDACACCLHALDTVKAEAPAPVAGAYLGIPALQYFGGRIGAYLAQREADLRLRAEADGVMLISAMYGHRDGAAMVCGTGSGLYMRTGGQIRFFGGWGWLIGGGGSGFLLGLRAVQAAARAKDGCIPPTLLTDLLNRQCGGVITEHLPELYAGGRPYFASFAGTVFEARRAGDAVAEKIFQDSAEELAELVRSARTQSGPFRMALNGGIFRAFPEYAEEVRRLSPPDVTMEMSDVPPVFGAVYEALADAGIAENDAFKARLAAAYAALTA